MARKYLAHKPRGDRREVVLGAEGRSRDFFRMYLRFVFETILFVGGYIIQSLASGF